MTEKEEPKESQPVTQSNNPAEKCTNKDACTWAMLCHLSGLAWLIIPFLGGIIAPLIIWQIKKDIDPFVDRNGKEALNFQISILIYAVIAGFLIMICVGKFLLPLVVIADIVFVIIASVKAANGDTYRYPLTIRFVS